MSKQWTIENDTGAELTVRAPNGVTVELDANSADPRERFAYFAIRQQARDIKLLTQMLHDQRLVIDDLEHRRVKVCDENDQLRADLAAAVARAGQDEARLAAIAAAPQFVAGEVTRPMCHGAWARFWSEPNTGDSCDQARRWLEAWRSELGPALGMVEIREPTPEECKRMENQFMVLNMRLETSAGRDMLDACRAVMWPKEGL